MSVVDPSGLTPTAGDPSAIGTDVADLAAVRPLRADVWRRFRRDKAAVIALGFIVLLVIMAIFAPLIAPHGYAELTPDLRAGPSAKHLFGTDIIGRDMFSRVVYGARVSLTIGILASTLSLTIGVLLGAVAGFFGGWLDVLVSRITDIFLAIPYIVLAIAIAAVFGGSQMAVIIIIGTTTWMSVTRIVRASFLSLKQQEYVEAATALGFSRSRIIFRHILPNALQPIIVYGTISIAGVILTEAALSFLGVGVRDPTPAWGLMISQGKGQLVSAPHLLFFPAGALVLTVLAFVFVGDGLRDALDPKQK
jgi:ABC-type dipeptide/oligopeptide/nickel transport system permease subunit